MRSLQVTGLHGPSSVQVQEVEEPVAGLGEVLVEVRAVGISWPDLLQTRGEYSSSRSCPFQLGVDFAGVVRSVPDPPGEVAWLRPGQRVACVLPYGGGGEVVAVPFDAVFPLPDELSFEQGAAVPMNYLTAHFALTVRGGLSDGLAGSEVVLVHGAAGGVGTASVQVARGLGAQVIAVVSTQEKAAVARAAGADHAVLVDGFGARVRELTDGRGVDVVVDVVGADLMTDSLRSLAPLGRLLVVGFTGGTIPEVKVNRLLLNNIDVRGVGWGAYAMRRPGFMQQQWEALLPMMSSGVIDPPVGRVSPVESVVEALEEMAARRTVGKSVLTFT